MVKVEWKEYYGTDATWEKEDEMRLRYPHLFPDEGKISLEDQTSERMEDCDNPVPHYAN